MPFYTLLVPYIHIWSPFKVWAISPQMQGKVKSTCKLTSLINFPNIYKTMNPFAHKQSIKDKSVANTSTNSTKTLFYEHLMFLRIFFSSYQYLQLGGEHKVYSCPQKRLAILPIILTGNSLSAVTIYLQRLWQFSEQKLVCLLTINALPYLYLNWWMNSSHI